MNEHSPQRLRELIVKLGHEPLAEIPDVAEALESEALEILVALEEQLEALRAERDSLMADSWRAFAESGGDTDGDLRWHCSPAMAGMQLIDAVVELRKDYDDAIASNPAKERE